MTGEAEWETIQAPEGGIMGISSLSKASTIKRAGFDDLDEDFEQKERYADWHFVYRPAMKKLGK